MGKGDVLNDRANSSAIQKAPQNVSNQDDSILAVLFFVMMRGRSGVISKYTMIKLPVVIIVEDSHREQVSMIVQICVQNDWPVLLDDSALSLMTPAMAKIPEVVKIDATMKNRCRTDSRSQRTPGRCHRP